MSLRPEDVHALFTDYGLEPDFGVLADDLRRAEGVLDQAILETLARLEREWPPMPPELRAICDEVAGKGGGT